MLKYLIAALLVSGSAFAGDVKQPEAPPAPPTVTLTQAELSQIIQAEVAVAVGAEKARETAAAAYAKVQAAFAPKK